MQLKLIITIVVLFIVVILGAALIAIPSPTPAPTPTPGATTTEPFVSENVIVTSPLSHESVPRTFRVAGQARGSWFFGASFPLQVRDPENNNVGGGIAQTADNWMTTEFVSFEGKVEVEDYSGPANLVLLKDNPSGLPELEDSVEFPIVVQ
ncbi:hypothetical protein HYW60_03785 [Candidatus Kaiserbacteria bacterium]|nr:hypothetical protein [Candidatus Kaiserbacteria bacterium]